MTKPEGVSIIQISGFSIISPGPVQLGSNCTRSSSFRICRLLVCNWETETPKSAARSFVVLNGKESGSLRKLTKPIDATIAAAHTFDDTFPLTMGEPSLHSTEAMKRETSW